MKPAAKSIPIEKARPGLDFRLLFESTPGLFVVVLPDAPIFTIVAVSEAYLRAAKRSREELVDQGIFEVFATPGNPVHTATLQNLRSSFERVLSGRQPDSMLVQKYDIPDGTAVQERYWSPQNSPVFDSDGEVAFIIHRVEDVTDFARLKRIEAEHGELSGELHIRSGQIEAELVLRGRQVAEAQRIVDEHRRVEQQLLASETRFTMASAEAPIGMVLTTPDGQILEVNRAYMNMLGYTREELASGNSAHFTHPDDVAPTREFFASLRDGSRDTATLEKRYLRKDGELLWARASASMRRDPGGKATQLIAIIEDITERKRAEEKLRAIYDGTYEYIGLLAPDGTLLEANRAALEFAESSPKEVIGRPFWLMPWFTQTPGASEAAQEGVHRAAQGEFVRYEATVKHSSGDLLTFDISLHPIHDERGHVILIVPEGRNITDRKAMERRNAILVQLDDATRPLADPDEITLTAARLLGEYLQVNRCAYADVEDDEDTFNLTGDYNRDVPSIVGRYTFAQFGAECLRLMREGKPYIVEDAENDPRVGESVGSYRLTLIRSVICVPMFKAGRLVAAMAVHQTTPRKWKHEEVELLQLVASRCWESIERVHVTRELREREQRVRFLAESIPQMVWTATPDGMLDYVNSQGSTYFGVKPEAMMGTGWLKGVYPEDQERTVNRWQQSLATGNPYESAFRLLRGSDGTWRWHLARAQPLTGPAGNVVQWFGTCTDIEDERQAEVSLRQQWQTFDTALSHTPDFTYIFDLDGRFQYINRALLALLQKSFEQAVGKNFFDLDYPPDIAARLQRQIQQVIDTKEPVRDQTPFTGPTGETRHYEYIFVPVLGDDRRVNAVAGSTRDITQQFKAEKVVEQDRRRWRELLLQAPAAIALLRGPEHRFEWVNKEYIRFIARPAEALVGKTVLEGLPEVDEQIYVNLLNRVYQTGEPFVAHESPIRLTGADGTLRDLYVNFVYLATRDIAGEIDGIFAHVTDVTDMVLARKQVEDSERQFRTLAETIPHLAWMADETGHIFWYNRRWYDYTGTVFEDMEGWGWQKVHDPQVLPDIVAAWKSAIGSGQPFEMVVPLKGSDSSFRSFLTRAEPVKDNQGRVVRWLGTNTDITDQRRTEDELRRMNRELEEFAYVASHDLREPLRMVNIYTHLIVKTLGEVDGKLGLYSGFVRRGVAQMEKLINDLLTYSRTVQAEELPVGIADLSVSLNEAMSVLKDRFEESGALVTAPPLPAVRGDTGQMSHVFQNILSNALKYRKEGVCPQIVISCHIEADHYIISVRDNGIGFEPQYAERIFGLFKRLHKDEYPGTGLGLAICKRIVERHGGRMWAEGYPGEGCVFRFSVPRVQPS